MYYTIDNFDYGVPREMLALEQGFLAYKQVSVYSRKNYSLIVKPDQQADSGGVCVEYVAGKLAKPRVPNSGLFIFLEKPDPYHLSMNPTMLVFVHNDWLMPFERSTILDPEYLGRESVEAFWNGADLPADCLMRASYRLGFAVVSQCLPLGLVNAVFFCDVCEHFFSYTELVRARYSANACSHIKVVPTDVVSLDRLPLDIANRQNERNQGQPYDAVGVDFTPWNPRANFRLYLMKYTEEVFNERSNNETR